MAPPRAPGVLRGAAPAASRAPWSRPGTGPRCGRGPARGSARPWRAGIPRNDGASGSGSRPGPRDSGHAQGLRNDPGLHRVRPNPCAIRTRRDLDTLRAGPIVIAARHALQCFVCHLSPPSLTGHRMQNGSSAFNKGAHGLTGVSLGQGVLPVPAAAPASLRVTGMSPSEGGRPVRRLTSAAARRRPRLPRRQCNRRCPLHGP